MSVNVRHCLYCEIELRLGQIVCDRCAKERVVTRLETEIDLGSITYSRSTVGRGPTGIELVRRGHFPRRAIACEHMSEALQDQVREFVLNVEIAHEPAHEEKGVTNEATG